MLVTDEMVETALGILFPLNAAFNEGAHERLKAKTRSALEAALSHAAGQEAWIDLADTPFGRGYTTSLDPLSMPAGRYVLTPAVARSEGEEGA